jgi:hypothetical protein
MTTTPAQNATGTLTVEQATDEAVLRLTRKLRRLYPAAYADLLGQLPQGAREALNQADNRADVVRGEHGVDKDGVIGLAWPTYFEPVGEDDEA